MNGRGLVVLERIAELACPPGLREDGLLEPCLREFKLHLKSLWPAARRMTGPGLVLFDQAARLHPANRGHRFTTLDAERADAHLHRVLYGQTGLLPRVVRLTKSLVVMAYYELPEVKRRLGYDPASYVAVVAARRRERYGPEIRRAEQARP
jgi:hypothetical protein